MNIYIQHLFTQNLINTNGTFVHHKKTSSVGITCCTLYFREKDLSNVKVVCSVELPTYNYLKANSKEVDRVLCEIKINMSMFRKC